jgi:hypothetical protein
MHAVNNALGRTVLTKKDVKNFHEERQRAIRLFRQGMIVRALKEGREPPPEAMSEHDVYESVRRGGTFFDLADEMLAYAKEGIGLERVKTDDPDDYPYGSKRAYMVVGRLNGAGHALAVRNRVVIESNPAPGSTAPQVLPFVAEAGPLTPQWPAGFEPERVYKFVRADPARGNPELSLGLAKGFARGGPVPKVMFDRTAEFLHESKDDAL